MDLRGFGGMGVYQLPSLDIFGDSNIYLMEYLLFCEWCGIEIPKVEFLVLVFLFNHVDDAVNAVFTLYLWQKVFLLELLLS